LFMVFDFVFLSFFFYPFYSLFVFHCLLRGPPLRAWGASVKRLQGTNWAIK